MKILILGGNGLIGTGIAQLMASDRHSVTIFSRTKPRSLPSGCRHISGDRADVPRFVQRFRRGQRYDVVIDLLTYTAADALSLVAAFAGRTTQVVFCSTVEVYAKTAQLPVSEDSVREPLTEYGSDKVHAETVLSRAAEAGAFALTTLRPAYTYGEGKPFLYALGDREYLARIEAGRPIVVPGDGTTTWVACHRDDVAHAFASAAGNERAYHRVFNVTGQQPMSWNEFHAAVATALGAPAPTLVHLPTDLLLRVLPPRLLYPQRHHIFSFNYLFDTAEARRELAFNPGIELHEGVHRVRGSSTPAETRSSRLLHDRLLAAWQEAQEAVDVAIRFRRTSPGTKSIG